MPRDRPRRVIALDTSNAHNGTVNPGRNASLGSCSCPRRGRLAGSVLPCHLSDQRDRPCHGRAAAFRPESVELGSDGLPARVEVVEELGADAYVFCLVELEGKEAKLVARVDSRRVPERGRSGCAPSVRHGRTRLRRGERRAPRQLNWRGRLEDDDCLRAARLGAPGSRDLVERERLDVDAYATGRDLFG